MIENPALQHLASFIRIEDWSSPELVGGSEFLLASDLQQDSLIDDISRTIFRSRQRHVLLVGSRGTGKTTVLRKVALAVHAGQPKYLSSKRVLYADLSNVGPEDSRACAETLFNALPADDDVILCLDHFASLIERLHGGDNKPLLRALLARPNISLVGTLQHWQYIEKILADHLMNGLFVRLDVAEPDRQAATCMARQAARLLEMKMGINFPHEVVDRAVVLTATYLMAECQPGKAIDVLRQVGEELVYENTQLGRSHVNVQIDQVVRVISKRTNISPETIAGQGRVFDFAAALTDAVVGQEHAVAQVAQELQLIAAGLTEPDKPASVMMFAGITGVGKTEIAKRIAELYSSSGRLQVYSMGNYTEAHSVSGLIGVPPGYVGHEDGGRLVSDLLADPYAVFLFDEAEKCHPNVWKPFLNLFDEGWIVDQRGRKAYGDRAIFILTTNAGDRSIAQLSQTGNSPEMIAEHVRKALSRVRQERSSQPVFPPQFLSRIKRIIVFNPLSPDAFLGIAQRVIDRLVARWRTTRQKELYVAPEAMQAIADMAVNANDQGEGQEGGRVVKKLVSEKIEHQILLRTLAAPQAYDECDRIEVGLLASNKAVVSDHAFQIVFR